MCPGDHRRRNTVHPRAGTSRYFDHYVYGLDGHIPLVRYRDTDANGSMDETQHYTWDANGNITSMLGLNGSVVERYTYEAYGRPSFWSGSWASRTGPAQGNRILFGAAYFQDRNTDLYFANARYYHSTLGRFISRDPLADAYQDGPNLYQYVRGNPINWVDPSGTWLQKPAPRSIADVFDDPSRPFNERIAAQNAALGLFNRQLSDKDKSLTNLFVDTQQEILSKLANGACPCLTQAEEEWLLNTVRDFMRPLIESLHERANNKVISNAGWRWFFIDLDKGAFQNVRPPFIPFPMPERDAAARAMALNHINRNFMAALLNNGIGSNAMWACIGKVVDEAALRVIGPVAGPGMGFAGAVDDDWNVGSIRDRMREFVRYTRLGMGFTGLNW